MSRPILPKSPIYGDRSFNIAVQVPTIPLLEVSSDGRDFIQHSISERPSLHRIDTDLTLPDIRDDERKLHGHRHTCSFGGRPAPTAIDTLNSASSDSMLFSQSKSSSVDHALPMASLQGPYISISSRKGFPALPPSTAFQLSRSAIPSSPDPFSPIDDLSGDSSAVEDDSESEDVWDLRPYDISWGNSYYGYKDGTLPGPDGTCIFLRSPIPLKYQRTGQACEKCRERKAKCSGTRPSCSRCVARGLACLYAPETKRTRAYDSSDEEKPDFRNNSEAGKSCHKPRPSRRMTLPFTEPIGCDQSSDAVYSSHHALSIQPTLRRSRSTMELAIHLHPPTSSNSAFAVSRSSSEHPTLNDFAYYNTASPFSPALGESLPNEKTLHVNGLKARKHSSCEQPEFLSPFDTRVLPYDTSMMYGEYAENWASPIYYQANEGSALQMFPDDSGDLLDTRQLDSLQPTGLPMAAPLESVTTVNEEFHSSFDPYLEPASMDLEMRWCELEGLGPNDSGFDYTEHTLNLFAFEQ